MPCGYWPAFAAIVRPVLPGLAFMFAFVVYAAWAVNPRRTGWPRYSRGWRTFILVSGCLMAFGTVELVIQSMLVARTNARLSCAALHDRIEQANQRLPWARHE